jgi:hypothetical protein
MDVKPNTIGFMVGLSSMMQHQELFRLNIKSLLVQVKPSVQRSDLKSGCMNSVAWRLHGTTTVIMVSLLLLNFERTAN